MAERKKKTTSSSGHLVVYLSDLSGSPQTRDVAENLQKALECMSPQLEFRSRFTGAIEVAAYDDESCNKKNPELVVKYTIYKEEEALLDIVVFPYHRFTTPLRSSIIPLGHLLELSLAVASSILLVAWAVARRTFGRSEGGHCCRGVLHWMLLWYVAAIFYWAALIWSLVEVASNGFTSNVLESMTFGATIILIVVSFLAPGTLSRRPSESYDGVLGAFRYIFVQRTRQSTQQALKNLLNQAIGEWGNYPNISLLGYSGGSIVALDAVFPFTDAAAGKTILSKNAIHNVITVACPFDFIRTLLPSYYSNNRVVYQADNNKLEWTNIFVPADALGSSFHHGSITMGPQHANNAVHANIDINCNFRKDPVEGDNIKRGGLPTNNILCRRGLLGNSPWLDELQLTAGFFLGYLIYAHFLYVELTDDHYWVFEDGVARHIVKAIFQKNCQPPLTLEEGHTTTREMRPSVEEEIKVEVELNMAQGKL